VLLAKEDTTEGMSSPGTGWESRRAQLLAGSEWLAQRSTLQRALRSHRTLAASRDPGTTCHVTLHGIQPARLVYVVRQRRLTLHLLATSSESSDGIVVSRSRISCNVT
jgi:hypothetical protein